MQSKGITKNLLEKKNYRFLRSCPKDSGENLDISQQK